MHKQQHVSLRRDLGLPKAVNDCICLVTDLWDKSTVLGNAGEYDIVLILTSPTVILTVVSAWRSASAQAMLACGRCF